MRPKISDVRILQCNLCRTIIRGSFSNLKRHVRLHGPKVNCQICEECGKSYQNWSNLRKHWENVHDKNIAPKGRQSTRNAKSE